MSFIPGAFADHPLRIREQVMEVIVRVADELDMPDKRGACICAGMCVAQEAGSDEDGDGVPEFWCPANHADEESFQYEHDSESDDGRSVGYFQQQKSAAGALWWGPTSSEMDLHSACTEFMKRLKKAGYDASSARAANDSVQRVQGSGRPDAYAKHWQLVNAVYNNVVNAVPQPGGDQVGFSGDPVWLEDVLRDWLGDRLVVEDGWAGRGVGGTMGDIWGVMIHHTGNRNESVDVIRDGRSDLAGPLSQCLIKPSGKCHLIAVGPCNHAGIGSYPGIGVNNGNERLIGFECAWPTINPDGTYNPNEKWPDAQIATMRDATAGVLSFLKYDQTHTIGHKEWATRPPNVKWDPGNVDMEKFYRPEVGKALKGQFRNIPVPPPVVVPPSTATYPVPPDYGPLMFDQTSGRWERLGWRTPVEALALLLDKELGTSNADKTGFTRGPKPKS